MEAYPLFIRVMLMICGDRPSTFDLASALTRVTFEPWLEESKHPLTRMVSIPQCCVEPIFVSSLTKKPVAKKHIIVKNSDDGKEEKIDLEEKDESDENPVTLDVRAREKVEKELRIRVAMD